MTGESQNPLFHRRPVDLFSDLLLHDGRAATHQQAILRHDVEAAEARKHFSELTPEQRQDLLAFLNSL
jgi:CxxC motif-containing protein (DUF1111 family)